MLLAMNTEPGQTLGLWRFAARSERLRSSATRDLLAVAGDGEIISLAGGLPAAETFPSELLREAADHVLRRFPDSALQYRATEGFADLRAWVAEDLRSKGLKVECEQVLITQGSQQALDLIAKVLLDSRSPVLVERPTYLGALQAFTVFTPNFVEMAADQDGPILDVGIAQQARCAYLIPSFQNPSGQVMTDARRDVFIAAAQRVSLPLIEDDPYSDLWIDAPAPAPLAARWPAGVVYLGSFSKTLSPGLRLGFVAAPQDLMQKLVRAKQAADLHGSELIHRIALATLTHPRFAAHAEKRRALYRERRDGMAAALRQHLSERVFWRLPGGGMFFWLKCAARQDGVRADTSELLQRALRKGVAFVPGREFYAQCPDLATLRLAFTTHDPRQTEIGLHKLAQALDELTGETH